MTDDTDQRDGEDTGEYMTRLLDIASEVRAKAVTDEAMRQDSIRDIAAERRKLAEQATAAARAAHQDNGLQVRVYTAPEMMDSRTSRALRLISYLGVTFTADSDEQAVEAFCSLLLLAGAALEEFDLAIEPVIELAGRFRARSDVKPEVAPSAVAAAVLAVMPHVQWDMPGRDAQLANVVDAIAMAIAKAWDDCEIAHDLRIDPLELWQVSAERMVSSDGATLDGCIFLDPPKCAVPYAPAPLRRRA